MIEEIFSLYILVVVFNLFFGCQPQNSNDDTLAFKDAQVTPTFSREDTFLGHIRDIVGTYLGHIWDNRIDPLGQFRLVVAMSVHIRLCLFAACPLPMQFFSRPLIGPQIT